MSESNIHKALAAARAEIENPHMDSVNPHFKSKFASLKAVINATIPVYAKHGIAVMQDLQTTDSGISCITHFCHESGESIRFGPLTIPAGKQDAHGLGSAGTYAKRYHLAGLSGVAGDDDDDGGQAVASTNAQQVEKDVTARYVAHADAFKKHWESIVAIKEYLAADNLSAAWEAYQEIPDDDKTALRVAPTKGAIWTLDEAKKMKQAAEEDFDPERGVYKSIADKEST